MQTVLNQLTLTSYSRGLAAPSTLEEDVQFCAKFGFGTIDLWKGKVDDACCRLGREAVRSLFLESGVRPEALASFVVERFGGADTERELAVAMRSFCEIGALTGASKILVIPPFHTGLTRREIRRRSVALLRMLADIAAPFHISPVYEFIGLPACAVNTFAQMAEIIDEVGVPGVGMCLDSIHFYAMNSHIADLERANPRHISLFHLNDSYDLPPGQVDEKQRLWPGRGVIALDELLGTLKRIGYGGNASIEVFFTEPLTAEEAARLSRTEGERAIGEYFG